MFPSVRFPDNDMHRCKRDMKRDQSGYKGTQMNFTFTIWSKKICEMNVIVMHSGRDTTPAPVEHFTQNYVRQHKNVEEEFGKNHLK